MATVERRVPTTYERASTELVRCRKNLAAARDSLEAAVGILRHLNGDAGFASDSTRALEAVIGDLEQAEAALRAAKV